MNIPTISCIENALDTYYRYSEIGNREICIIFGKLSSATIAKLKRHAKEKMNEFEVCSHGMYRVNTKVAFIAWGIDVVDLEERFNKLKSLKLQ